MSNWTEVWIILLVCKEPMTTRGTNDNKNYNSIQRGDHDTTLNRQKPNMNGERKTDVTIEWGEQESAFNDILMNGHTQKTQCHTKTKLQH